MHANDLRGLLDDAHDNLESMEREAAMQEAEAMGLADELLKSGRITETRLAKEYPLTWKAME